MTNNQYRLLSSLVAVLTVLSATEKMKAHDSTLMPKVVVNIIVDQLRSDYLQAFMPLYEDNGFKKFLQEGLVYTQADNPAAMPDRASSTATILTGTTPSRHGIIALQWLDKNTLRPIFCVDPIFNYKKTSPPNYSPERLQVSTLGDEVKIGTGGRGLVYGIAPFKDVAILSAGHAADGAFWIDENAGTWTGSNFYPNTPLWVSSQNTVLSHDIEQTWKPINQRVGSFRYFLSGGKQTSFAHKFSGKKSIYEFTTSGLINETVSLLAQNCINQSTLGIDDYPDLLSIVFYAGTYKNQPIDKSSMELQDTYVRLDKSIGDLLRCIEHKIGLNNALIVLTSTGTSSKSDDVDFNKYKIPSGVFEVPRATALLNMYLSAIYGHGQYIENSFGTQLYLNHKLIEEKQISLSELLNRAESFLIQLNGVKNVYTSYRLIEGSWSPEISKIKNAYNARISGDIVIEVMPGWRYTDNFQQESQQIRSDYVPFPIIFLGNNIKKEKIHSATSIDYIAPTLSKAMRIRAPNASNHKPLF